MYFGYDVGNGIARGKAKGGGEDGAVVLDRGEEEESRSSGVEE